MLGDHPLLNATALYNCLLSGNELEEPILKKIFSNPDVSGNFACIIKDGLKTFLITDVIRSQPLHIIKNPEGIEVVDYLDPLEPQPLSDQKVNAFLNLGFSLGGDNCYKNVYSLQAAEIVSIEGGDFSSSHYFKYIATKSSKRKELQPLRQEFDSELERSFRNMLQSAPAAGNWIIPLSGGHDSRLIVNYLHRAGVKNVLCFSYGVKKNLQSRISEKVAKEAGYPWYFVEYTEEKWNALNESGLVEKFIQYTFQGVSTPHLQDFLAVYELKEKGIIREGDIFVPGHSAITIPYSPQTEQFRSREEGILFSFNKTCKTSFRKIEEVPEFFQEGFRELNLQPTEIFAYFNWQGRQSKFIGNSIRVYEFFGFESRLPLWERRLVDFWLALSPELRFKRYFMLNAERNGILSEGLAAIPFEDELKQKPQENPMKKKLRSLIPNPLIIAVLRATGKRRSLPEGGTTVYAQKAKTMRELIHPFDDFPQESRALIRPLLGRYPYQLNFHLATRILTIRSAYDRQREEQPAVPVADFDSEMLRLVSEINAWFQQKKQLLRLNSSFSRRT